MIFGSDALAFCTKLPRGLRLSGPTCRCATDLPCPRSDSGQRSANHALRGSGNAQRMERSTGIKVVPGSPGLTSQNNGSELLLMKPSCRPVAIQSNESVNEPTAVPRLRLHHLRQETWLRNRRSTLNTCVRGRARATFGFPFKQAPCRLPSLIRSNFHNAATLLDGNVKLLDCDLIEIVHVKEYCKAPVFQYRVQENICRLRNVAVPS
jgi:hypothetical protein